ncbi:hypothetical protein GCM10028787_29840 [Brachybacterium horti]
MSWRAFSETDPSDIPHARLEPFKHRVARFSDAHGADSFLYVDASIARMQIGGHLWWRRWSEPHVVVFLYVRFSDGRLEDLALEGALLDAEIDAWERGEYVDEKTGSVHALTWLDNAKSVRAWEAFEGPNDARRAFLSGSSGQGAAR